MAHRTRDRLWESGEYSDLTVMAEDREYKVHKNIICPASLYFKAVCSEELNDTPTNSIGVSEPASVIEELLRNVYGHSPDVATLLEDPVAAYLITSINDQIYGAISALAFEKREHPHVNRLIVAIGQVLFEYPKVLDPSILEWYVRQTYKIFWYIVYDDVGWQLLTLSPDYYKEVMRKAYEEYRELEGEPAPSSEERDRELLKIEVMAKLLKMGLEN
ncbi:hypothetical protein HII31_12865 [Pseudocercospora fuligena]|uniref:BTB domain-containing protein n=1 Tax=Pseudocercospora fuligena TaxID=685502 RepID=A0A8H6R744_9PEZI|nr:hypothetical protein HII31_12865 [Pseudocercospora fuligena]